MKNCFVIKKDGENLTIVKIVTSLLLLMLGSATYGETQLESNISLLAAGESGGVTKQIAQQDIQGQYSVYSSEEKVQLKDSLPTHTEAWCQAVVQQDLNSLEVLLQQGVAIDTKKTYAQWRELIKDCDRPYHVAGLMMRTARQHWSALYVATFLLGSESVVKFLLDHGADVEEVDADGDALLHCAIRYQVDKPVRDLLLAHPRVQKSKQVNKKNKKENTPLHEAVRKNDPHMVGVLLAYKEIGVNEKNRRGKTPLHKAAKNKHEAIVKILLTHKDIHVNVQDSDGKTPLYLALWGHDSMAIAKLLIAQGAEVDIHSKKRSTIWHFAARRSDIPFFQYLLSHSKIDVSTNINMEDELGDTPMYDAVSFRNKSMQEFLLQQGSMDVNVCVAEKFRGQYDRIIHGFVSAIDRRKVKLAIKKGAELDHEDGRYEITPLQIALLRYDNDKEAYFEIIKLLLEGGVDGDRQDQETGETPLCLAVANRYWELVELLVPKVNINKPSKRGESPLYLALEQGCWDVAEFLITYGAKVDGLDKEGNTLLYNFAKRKKTDQVKFLITYGAELNLQEECGDFLKNAMASMEYGEGIGQGGKSRISTKKKNLIASLEAWFQAVNEQDIVRLEALLAQGVDINIKITYPQWQTLIARQSVPYRMAGLMMRSAKRDWSALDVAVFLLGSEKVVQFLFDKGINLNQEDLDGNTILHGAMCYHAGTRIVELIWQHPRCQKVLGKHQNKKGNTLLHQAVLQDDLAMVKALLACRGIKVNQKNKQGNTPLHEAIKRDKTKIIKALLSHKHIEINAKNKAKETPLYLFISKRDSGSLRSEQMVRLLIAHGANVDLKNEKGPAIWYFLALGGNVNLFQYALSCSKIDKKSLVNSCSKENTELTPLYGALEAQKYAMIQYLLTQGARDINLHISNRRYDDRVIHSCIYHRDMGMIKLLLNQGADLNAETCDETTPLSLALDKYNKYFDIAELLLKHGADINKINERRKTKTSFLHRAIPLQDWEMVEFLVEHGIDLNKVDQQGETPLDLALQKGNIDLIEFLIEKGAEDRSARKK